MIPILALASGLNRAATVAPPFPHSSRPCDPYAAPTPQSTATPVRHCSPQHGEDKQGESIWKRGREFSHFAVARGRTGGLDFRTKRVSGFCGRVTWGCVMGAWSGRPFRLVCFPAMLAAWWACRNVVCMGVVCRLGWGCFRADLSDFILSPTTHVAAVPYHEGALVRVVEPQSHNEQASHQARWD